MFFIDLFAVSCFAVFTSRFSLFFFKPMCLDVLIHIGAMASDIMEVAALGRPFTLGVLYDARSDKLIPGNV